MRKEIYMVKGRRHNVGKAYEGEGGKVRKLGSGSVYYRKKGELNLYSFRMGAVNFKDWTGESSLHGTKGQFHKSETSCEQIKASAGR